jgi:universal stress protein A
MKLRRILVATDFSDLARAAAGEAGRLAAEHGASLLVVHVLQPTAQVVTVSVPGVSLPDLDAELLRGCEEQLEALCAALGSERGVPVRAILRAGRPSVEILAVAAAEGCDLIVIATHGRSGLQHLVLGSVAERVVQRATVPVLVWRSRGA